MANTLSVTGSSRLSWSLTDAQAVGSAVRTVDERSSRTITHGTGPNQATVAYTNTHTVAASSTLSLAFGSISTSSFGSTGTLAVTTVKEMLVSPTGVTGAFVYVGGGSGVTGVKVNTGGEYHLCDYAVGLSPSEWVGSTLRVQNTTTGSINVDVSIVGIGSYS
jgi:hypothetical protein